MRFDCVHVGIVCVFICVNAGSDVCMVAYIVVSLDAGVVGCVAANYVLCVVVDFVMYFGVVCTSKRSSVYSLCILVQVLILLCLQMISPVNLSRNSSCKETSKSASNSKCPP